MGGVPHAGGVARTAPRGARRPPPRGASLTSPAACAVRLADTTDDRGHAPRGPVVCPHDPLATRLEGTAGPFAGCTIAPNVPPRVARACPQRRPPDRWPS